ncbi:MAG: arylsulfatase [Carboxylicivirga sp.]|jgi:arylsulfatase A-like enzyme|nr:arylsulfatase [Carboxylicivirga sp.]
MNYKTIIALSIVVLSTSCNLLEQKINQKPNIVIILADDLGSGDVNCYNPKSKIPTPSLDKIADEGVIFTDAHTNSSVCTPTRYGIITGRYCWRTRLKRGVLNGFSKHLINPQRTTIASLLKNNGYYTTGVGKWHLGMDFARDTLDNIDYSGKIENSPNVNGFDYFYGISASLDFPPYVYIENDHFTQVPSEKQEKLTFPRFLRNGDKAGNFNFETAWENLLEKAEGLIDHRPEDQPFFMYFALPSPHKPVWPDQRFVGKTSLGPYGDFVHQTDYIVGRIARKLKENGMEDNTLLMITSDNGSFMYRLDEATENDHLTDESVQGYFAKNHEANYNYRGTKADVWEAGHRVPFIVRWPEAIKSGQTKDETICTTDFLATIADVIKVPLADDEGEDSFSFLPLLIGKDDLYQRAPVINHSISGMFAIRCDNLKLVLGNGSGGRQIPRGKAWEKPYMLFDLENDIRESNDIIDENKEMAQVMEKKLMQIIESGSSKKTDCVSKD